MWSSYPRVGVFLEVVWSGPNLLGCDGVGRQFLAVVVVLCAAAGDGEEVGNSGGVAKLQPATKAAAFRMLLQKSRIAPAILF